MHALDPYLPIHRGARALIREARDAVRRAASGRAELDEVSARLRRLDRLLRAEARRHDEHVLPHLAALAPVLAAEIETRYDRCEGYAEELLRRLDRSAGAGAAERASLAARLEPLAESLFDEHAARIELEERQAAAVLARGLREGGLVELAARIEASLTDEERADRSELLLAGDPEGTAP